MTTFTTYIGKLDYLLGVNYVFIPEMELKKMGGLKSGRWICHLSPEVFFQCGFMSLSEGNAYVTINSARMKKLHLKTGDEIRVRFEKDESEFGIDLSIELQTVFDQDLEGYSRFQTLKPGIQRYIIYYVSQVKNSQLRIDRSIFLLNNLKKIPQGKETFRAILGKE